MKGYGYKLLGKSKTSCSFSSFIKHAKFPLEAQKPYLLIFDDL